MWRGFVCCLVVVLAGSAWSAPEWNDFLYLSGGGCWRKRLPVKIVNTSGTELKGETVMLTVGDELPLEGVRAEELRLTDAEGTELLFDLEKDGKKRRNGPLEAGTKFYFPAVAAAGGSSELVLYFDNPAAFEVPGFFWEHKEPARGARVEVGAIETLNLKRESSGNSLPASEYPVRYPVTVRNLTDFPRENVLVQLDLSGHALDDVSVHSLRLLRNGVPVTFLKIGSTLVFPDTIPAMTERNYLLLLHKNPVKLKTAGQLRAGSDVLSDQFFVRQQERPDRDAYRRILESAANIAPNPSFEKGADGEAEGWIPNVESVDVSGIRYSTPREGLFGRRAVRVEVERPGRWTGWRANVPLKAGKHYLFTAWMKGEKVSSMRDIYLHLRNTSIPGHVIYIDGTGDGSGSYDWKTAAIAFRVPAAAGKWMMRANLVTNASGKLTYDGVIIAETLPARIGEAEPQTAEPGKWRSWSVNPIVKVFPDTLCPVDPRPVSITLARNEQEPLQLALRHPSPGSGEVEIRAGAPINDAGGTLPAPEIGVVGFVPVDYPSNYYSVTIPPWERPIPNGAGLGDGTLWPDPIIPRNRFTPKPGRTSVLWLTFRAPADACPGRYRGTVELVRGNRVEHRIPYEVTVRSFTLPESRKMEGLFCIHLFGNEVMYEGRNLWGDRAEMEKANLEIADFLTSRKLATSGCQYWDYIDIRRDPATGKIHCDFTRFDKFAGKRLDELGANFLYIFPHTRFVFGLPPSKFLGLDPYPGSYPYPGADRLKLKNDYRKALFESTRQIWEHIREKGWQDKLYFYLADEPAEKPEIIQQGIALLDVLREAAPGMQIYCSTWRDIPEWHGKLNVWGVGIHGSMTPEEMAERRKAGDKLFFTLDGHFCLDTPLNAIERLLPYFCFKYDVEKYEFWSVGGMQHNQFKFGFPKFNISNPAPGVYRQTRFPNGDGYLLYDGRMIGYDGLVSSIRLENCRDGIEDHDYLVMLNDLVGKTGDREGAKLLEDAKSLVTIPNAGGRNSTALLPDPDRIPELRDRIAERIEFLRK